MPSTRPTYQQVMDVMRLMADVAALKGDPPVQRQLLIDELKRIVGTNQAMFVVGDDWWPGRPARWSHQTFARDPDETFLRYIVQLPMQADAFIDYSIHDPSPLQSLSIKRVTPDLAAEKKYELFTELRHTLHCKEGIGCMARLPGGRIVSLAMHQFHGAPVPTDRQRALAEFALAEITRLVERGHLMLPPAQPAEMPPRLRQMLDRLLAGHHPKRIAKELSLSIWTVREHMERLYRHYGVSGREKLMAKFIHAR